MAKKRNNKRHHGDMKPLKNNHHQPPSKKKKQQRHQQQQDPASQFSFSSSSSSSQQQVEFPLPYPHLTSSSSSSQPIPTNSFLRDVEPYKKSFQIALETSYQGFEIDTEESTSIQHQQNQKQKPQPQLFDHDSIEKSLLTMDKHGLFRTDVTQPFGLGTKCAKTYVTRCLLGEEGTTYKYLGLRMFAHPWGTKYSNGDGDELGQALNVISQLNDSLTERTAKHLNNLDKKRREQSAATTNNGNNKKMVQGRATFDVALINRMVDTNELKREPSMGDGRCSVSWHADSSLEHYSSIAVYHTILNDEMADVNVNVNNKSIKNNKTPSNNKSQSDRWSIALRVAHNSEGPLSSKKREAGMESSVVSDTPAIAVSLPSKSAYYLLDDFNHHHQHAVLVNDNDNGSNDDDNNRSSAGVRFASTHRLLREGHNIYYMIDRCRSTCTQFHKKGPKIWRSEQLLLTQIESEWIRQFFIQGEGHKERLWKYWKEPIGQLLMYWSRLEQRTKQVYDLLRYAAQERCRLQQDGGRKESSLKRKERDKLKKSLAAIEDLLSRGKKDSEVKMNDALNTIYIPMSKLIEERAKMRMLWDQRENDWVFKSMNVEYKPIKVPFQFNAVCAAANGSKKDSLKEVGESPLDGSSEDLKRMSGVLRQLGVAFLSQKEPDLPDEIKISSFTSKNEEAYNISGNPKKELLEERNEDEDTRKVHDSSTLQEATTEEKEKNTEQLVTLATTTEGNLDPTEHAKDLDWYGWKNNDFALEMQHPWAGLLLKGNKTIETRSYNLPRALVGKKILILESQPGEAKVSSLGNILVGDKINESVKIAGWVIFNRIVIYRYRSKFEADEKRHLVQRNSGYGWKEDTKTVYGWVVHKKGKYKVSGGNNQKNSPTVQSLIRRMRSLYSVVALPAGSSKKKTL